MSKDIVFKVNGCHDCCFLEGSHFKGTRFCKVSNDVDRYEVFDSASEKRHANNCPLIRTGCVEVHPVVPNTWKVEE